MIYLPIFDLRDHVKSFCYATVEFREAKLYIFSWTARRSFFDLHCTKLCHSRMSSWPPPRPYLRSFLNRTVNLCPSSPRHIRDPNQLSPPSFPAHNNLVAGWCWWPSTTTSACGDCALQTLTCWMITSRSTSTQRKFNLRCLTDSSPCYEHSSLCGVLGTRKYDLTL